MEAVNYIFGKWLRRHLLLPRRLQSSWVIKYSINFQLTFFLFSLRELLLRDLGSIESRKPRVQVSEGLKWKKVCQGWKERRKRQRFEGERSKGFKRTNGKMEGGRRSWSNGKKEVLAEPMWDLTFPKEASEAPNHPQQNRGNKKGSRQSWGRIISRGSRREFLRCSHGRGRIKQREPIGLF